MKPERSESLFIEELYSKSQKSNTGLGKIKDIEKLTGDASTRRYYRLESETNTYVACLDDITESESNRFVDVQDFLNGKEIRVPHILDTLLQKGYILEEDLGDITFLQLLSQIDDTKKEYELYKKVVDELIKIHKIPREDLVESRLFDLAFDETKLMQEIDFTEKFFLRKLLKIENDDDMNEIRSEFLKICSRLSAEQRVLTHRDFHSRNIMVKEDELVIIDFQDARMGIPQYDLASLLDDCYYDLDSDNYNKLLKYYYDQMKNVITSQGSYENFISLYNDMTLQRVYKAIGSFAYIYETRKDARYLRYIGFAMEKLKRVMFSDPRYSELRKKITRYYYES